TMLAGTGLTMRHYVTNCMIEGDGARATATTYVLAFTGSLGNLMPRTGRYEDELHKVGGKWLLHVGRGFIEMPGARERRRGLRRRVEVERFERDRLDRLQPRARGADAVEGTRDATAGAVHVVVDRGVEFDALVGAVTFGAFLAVGDAHVR